MHGKRMGVSLAVLGVAAQIALTAPPTADGDLTVHPGVGPWMILVTYFEEAPPNQVPQPPPPRVMAEELAREIRKDYKLPAYVFNRGAEERRKQQEYVRQIRERCPEGRGVRVLRVKDQWAVLIGAWDDMETARKALDAVRQLKPPAEKFMAKTTVVKASATEGGKPEATQTYINPFRAAFVCRNPTVPAEKPDHSKPDPRLKVWNKDESFSVLKCPKPWTLVVKQFSSPVALQQGASTGLMSKLGLDGGKMLNATANQAHSFAELLRKLGFDAYVMHMEYGSIVTVGNFDSIDDPRLQQTQHSLAKLKLNGASQYFELFAQPLPMEIPRP